MVSQQAAQLRGGLHEANGQPSADREGERDRLDDQQPSALCPVPPDAIQRQQRLTQPRANRLRAEAQHEHRAHGGDGRRRETYERDDLCGAGGAVAREDSRGEVQSEAAKRVRDGDHRPHEHPDGERQGKQQRGVDPLLSPKQLGSRCNASPLDVIAQTSAQDGAVVRASQLDSLRGHCSDRGATAAT
eukprot:1895298-Prymnesium_polylepis.1